MPGLASRSPGPGDQIVEIGDPGGALGAGYRRRRTPGRRAGPAAMSAASRAPLWIRSNSPISDCQPPGMRFVIGIGLDLARRDLRACPCRSSTTLRSSGSAAARSIGVSASQRSIVSAMSEPGRRAPGAVGVGDRAQQVAIEAVVAAMLRRDSPRPSLRAGPSARGSSARSSRARPSAAIASGCARRPGDIRPRRLSPSRRLRHWTSRISGSSPVLFGVGQQVGQRAPHQLLLGAALDRLEAGRDPGLGREGGEQATGRSCGWSGS